MSYRVISPYFPFKCPSSSSTRPRKYTANKSAIFRCCLPCRTINSGRTRQNDAHVHGCALRGLLVQQVQVTVVADVAHHHGTVGRRSQRSRDVVGRPAHCFGGATGAGGSISRPGAPFLISSPLRPSEFTPEQGKAIPNICTVGAVKNGPKKKQPLLLSQTAYQMAAPWRKQRAFTCCTYHSSLVRASFHRK